MNIHRRSTKREILGQLRVEYLFSIQQLPGVDSNSSRYEVLGAFLKAGDARAERLIETDGGLIFLSSIANRPNTGAIYVYHEESRTFLWMRFDRDDDLNGADFDQAVWAYNLLKWPNLRLRAEKAATPAASRAPRTLRTLTRRGHDTHRLHLVS